MRSENLRLAVGDDVAGAPSDRNELHPTECTVGPRGDTLSSSGMWMTTAMACAQVLCERIAA